MPEFGRTLGEAFRTYAKSRREGREKDIQESLAVLQLSQQAAATQSQELLREAQRRMDEARLALEERRVTVAEKGAETATEREARLAATAGAITPSGRSSLQRFIIQQHDKLRPKDPFAGRPDQLDTLKNIAAGILPTLGINFDTIFPELAVDRAAVPVAELEEPLTEPPTPELEAEPPTAPAIFPPTGFLPGIEPPEAPPIDRREELEAFFDLDADEQFKRITGKSIKEAEPADEVKFEDTAKSMNDKLKRLIKAQEDERKTGLARQKEKRAVRRATLEAEIDRLMKLAQGGPTVISKAALKFRARGLKARLSKSKLFVKEDAAAVERDIVNAWDDTEIKQKYSLASLKLRPIKRKLLEGRKRVVQLEYSELDALGQVAGEKTQHAAKQGVDIGTLMLIMNRFKKQVFPQSELEWAFDIGPVEEIRKPMPSFVSAPTTKPAIQISQKEWKTLAGRARIMRELGLAEAQAAAIDEAFMVQGQ